MRIYLAGPMRGFPQLNYPAFTAAARVLRRLHEVWSPAEASGGLPLNEHSGAAGGLPREYWLRQDVGIITHWADAIVALEGWRQSPGATLEMFLGQELGLELFEYDRGGWANRLVGRLEVTCVSSD